ncbi:MAG: VOC family protein [Gemmataceae bacterium]
MKGDRKPGQFCWINMLTPQPAESRDFYTQLFGWTYEEIPGVGHIMVVQGHAIGGLFDLNAPTTPPGIPAHIGVMVKVESADAVAEKTQAVGGTATPAMDIMDSGRMACCTDPTGARFDLWQPKTKPGTDVDTDLHGATSWFEIITTDPTRAAKFYGDLFGWTHETMPLPNAMEYTTFKLDGEFVGGMMKIVPQMGNVPPHWGVYFTVNDADETARQATVLGAKICVPPTDIANVGRFCGITSPQGVSFYAIKYVKR